ncbi:MAG: SCO family protein [Betaproteobacteria bacterium]|nr:SCO family protein [Betaproteobacteria bacterium]
MGRWSAHAQTVITGLLVAVAAVALAACGERGASGVASPSAGGFTAIDITGASYASKLELPDPSGQLRRLEDFKGKVVVVFFGYTQCPDVCPTTLADLAAVRKALGADGARVQPVFVSVDPQRDTPDVLKAYAQAFGDDVVALRGDEAQTKAAAQEFKVFYSKVPGKTPDTYTIDHTAGSYVFDTQGRIRLFMRHGQAAAAVEADLRRLLAGSAAS